MPMPTAKRKRNLAGTFEYPVLVIFKEKHDTEYHWVTSDEEFTTLCIKRVEDREMQRWYSSVEDAEKGIAKAEARLVIERQALASAQSAGNDLGVELDSWTIGEYQRRVETAEKYLKDYQQMLGKALHVQRVIDNADPIAVRDSAILLCQMEGGFGAYGRMEIVTPRAVEAYSS